MNEKKIAESLLDDGVIKIKLNDLDYRLYLALDGNVEPNKFYFEKSLFINCFCKLIQDGKKTQKLYQVDYLHIIQVWPEFTERAQKLLESAKKTEAKKP